MSKAKSKADTPTTAELPDEQLDDLGDSMIGLHGLARLLKLEWVAKDQNEYQKRLREGHAAMAKAAGVDVDPKVEDMGHIIYAGDGSTVRVSTDEQKPEMKPPKTLKPPVNGNGALAKFIVGGALALATAGGAGLLTYILTRPAPNPPPDPPAVVQPVEPPETRIELR